jgi:pilus assembly protein CpaE
VQAAVVVTELTLAAARDVIRILSWLKSNAPQSRVMVVANRVPVTGAPEVSRKEFETSIERKVDMVIPLDAKIAAQAAKLGKPLAEAGKGSKLGQSLVELSNRLLSTVEEVAEADDRQAKGKSLLGKLGDFKSLMPKNRKKAAA